MRTTEDALEKSPNTFVTHKSIHCRGFVVIVVVVAVAVVVDVVHALFRLQFPLLLFLEHTTSN